jgi:hypothetical protein
MADIVVHQKLHGGYLVLRFTNGHQQFFNSQYTSKMANASISLIKMLAQDLKISETPVMAFFELFSRDDFGKTLLYIEVPSYYTFTNNHFNEENKESQLYNTMESINPMCSVEYTLFTQVMFSVIIYV